MTAIKPPEPVRGEVARVRAFLADWLAEVREDLTVAAVILGLLTACAVCMAFGDQLALWAGIR